MVRWTGPRAKSTKPKSHTTANPTLQKFHTSSSGQLAIPTLTHRHQALITCIYILFYCLRQQFHFRPIQEMASTYRDRTAEFRSLSETLKKIGGITAVHHQQPENDPALSKPLTTPPPPPLPPAVAAANSSRSEFNKKASRIGLGIQETSHKITRLAQCKLICIVFYTVIVIWLLPKLVG